MKRMMMAALGLVAATLAVADSGVDEKAVRKNFADTFPQFTVSKIEPAPVEGMAQVELKGGGGSQWVYTSSDGRFIFTGELIELRDGKPVNLAEERLEKVRKAGLAKVDSKRMITYAADDQKAEIYAFTDITCGFCRKMHEHIEEYNEAGITVHYLAFPRGGPASEAAEDMRHIWCAKDRASALTDAKLKDKIVENKLGSCAGQVNDEYALGVEFGVRGTPAIYTAEGTQLGGYLTPEQMLQRLQL
ncbi:protein disulfide-isomerase [Alcanivorax balearicus MACL04]|uniref:Thiol:disulfide interchange protein n=1 Tax=Alloalcanivorax balearicus MACL04 TaxID=1177182 RepID=A0ABT2QZK9_9GAMM|nr:thioredoxin fold domain-containing protein [Alloalcanivorax balearicus]MCU5782955.1 protein disulfide-isomerase [Alloalcanivorax balearicus MACL04]